MASIRRRQLPDGTVRWDVRYRDGGGAQRTETFDRERDARTRRGTIEKALGGSGGTWTPAARLTIRDAAETWFERKKVAVADQTRLNYRSALDHWILPTLGARPVAAIKPSDVDAFRAKLAAEGKGANTIRNVTGVLSQILAELVADSAIPSNPADYRKPGKRPGRSARKITAPTDAQVRRIIAAARLEARPVLELAASTGLRRSELLSLTWADVDTYAREIHVRMSKTDAGVRIVPMFGSARRVLLEQKARSRFKRPENPVFATIVGTPHDPKAWHDREFHHARDEAELPGVRLHDFRHYAVSKLIEQDANILIVARIAGHARPDVTLRVYAHLFAAGLADAAERFDPARGILVASAGGSR